MIFPFSLLNGAVSAIDAAIGTAMNSDNAHAEAIKAANAPPSEAPPIGKVSMSVTLTYDDILDAVRRKVGENFALAHPDVNVVVTSDHATSWGSTPDRTVSVRLSLPLEAVA